MTAPETDSTWGRFMEALAPAPAEKILDIGAGDCSKAAQVLHFCGGAEVYAVDPDERRIASAKRKHPEIKSSVASAEELTFQDSFFDKAYSTVALHHFADLDRALGEIARVLRPGGAYVIVEVEPGSLPGRIFRLFGKIMGEKMEIMTQEQLLGRLRGSGKFAVVRSEALGSRYLIQLTRS